MGFLRRYVGSVSELVERIDSGETAEKCTALDFNGKGIGDSGVSQLCTVLNHFTALQKLYLDRNSISSAGVSVLCDILPQCTQLTQLSLLQNSIDDIGAKRIAETLKRTKLDTLYIGGNDIGRNGICALFLSAANSQTLTRLDIEGNSGLEDSVADIVDILPHCNTLQWLVVGYGEYSVSEEFRQQIRSAMQNCTAQLVVVFGGLDEDFAMGQIEFDDNAPAPDRSQLHSIAQRIGFPVDSDDSAHRDPLFDHILKSPVFQTAFLAAMKHGGLHVCRRRVAFVGDSRVGKTWTAKSLREEPNVHPRNEAEVVATRTAAAESTALCASKTNSPAVFEAAVIFAEARGTVNHQRPTDSIPVLDRSNTGGTTRGPTAPAEVQRSGTGTTNTAYKHHDNVHNFTFPPGLLEELGLDGVDTVCYLTLWDFGGQRMYHSWYQFFFSPGMIPCVVFDMSAIVGEKKDPESKEVVDAVQRIVYYAQQAVHFGGSDCRVLLVGTKIDRIAQAPEERKAVVNEAYQLIFDASPTHLSDTFYDFVCVDRNDSLYKPGELMSICDLNNDNVSRVGVDPGVQMLKAGLIRECVRNRTLVSGEEAEGESVSAAERVRSFLRQNILPRSWYEFERQLRDNQVWKSRNFCRARQLWEFADQVEDGPTTEVEFIAMLTSMAAAGSVVLTKEVQWDRDELLQSDSDMFMQSVVIVRPQWLIEVGQRLLPYPHEKQATYGTRLKRELSGLKQVGDFSKRLYKNATVFRSVLYEIMMRGNEDLESSFDDIIDLFEQRLILCPIRPPPSSVTSDVSRTPTNEWFIPSMIAFHSEHRMGVYNKVESRPSAQCIAMALEFEWLPPGLLLLLVGALMQEMKGCPTLAIAAGDSHRIQVAVKLAGFPSAVYIELPNGVGGQDIEVWTRQSSLQGVESIISKLMRSVLDAVCSACTRLCATPILAEPAEPIERGLLISKFAVPLVGNISTCVELQCVCEGTVSETCDIKASTRLYQEVLRHCKDAVVLGEGWLDPPSDGSELADGGTTSGDSRLVGKLSTVERNDLGKKFVELGDVGIWEAAAKLGLSREFVEGQCREQKCTNHAHVIVLNCSRKKVAEVEAAISMS